MSASDVNFVEEFATPTYEQWVAEVERALKGAPFDKKMLTKTYEGITLRPIYTRSDWPSDGDPSGFPAGMPFTRGGTASRGVIGGWDVRQRYMWPDPARCNEIILKELERGVTSIILRFDAAAQAGLDGDGAEAGALAGHNGIMLYSVDDLEVLLSGVYLDLVCVALESGPQFLPAAALLEALWQRRSIAADKAIGAFNADPVGVLAGQGALPTSMDDALARLAGLAKRTAATYAHVTAVRVDTSPYHDAGASETQDLAASMATAVTYLRAMTEAGMSIDDACRQIVFTYSLDADQFLSLCKLRAARKLWNRVAEACGASEPARAMRQHAITSTRMMTRFDPWVNTLRCTVACFAAGAGGADSITVQPFNALIGLPDELGRRVARNTQIVLSEESNLPRVLDAGGGSWYIESRTDDLARAAWAEFQAIEGNGGIVASLMDGSFAERIAAAYAEREKNIARRRDALTGVSEFPNIDEHPIPLEQPDLEAGKAAAADRLAAARKQAGATAGGLVDAVKAAGPGAVAEAAAVAAAGGVTLGALAAALAGQQTTVKALPTHRFAEAFEALREATDAAAEKNGQRPSIFLANLGPIAKHTARATFAKNFFEVGGIRALTNTGFKDAGSCAKAFKESGARIAIICSADPIYEEMVPQVAPALKQAGCEFLFLAGHPGDKKETYQGAGVDDFIFLGADVLKTLRSTLALLGVTDR
ncbi:MAG: methylmalonyl-CoA mutase [Rhodospirillales bacterium]|nr:MAG: methylmalonyl-CoA mutase [Rhodospirillales bacterium]